MTNKQAYLEARRRWGKAGAIRKTANGRTPCTHRVGQIRILEPVGPIFAVLGHGRNWAEAFGDADAHPDRDW